MKKKILALMASTMLATSIGYAAPITDLAPGETTVGYNHYNLDQYGHSIDNDSFYLENALSDKFNVGIERNGYSSQYNGWHTTDVYAHYKLDNNVRLIVGDRNYSDSSDKFFYGIGGNMSLAPKLDGYASVTTSSVETSWQTGVNYKMDGKTALHFGYKSDKYDGSSAQDGFGFGINHKF